MKVLLWSLFALCYLLAVGAAKRLMHPIILVPGDGGSQVEARLNRTSAVHYICSKTSDWYTLWLNLEQMIPEVVDCWVENMKLRYDPKTHTTSDSEGVETRIPGFGNTSTVEWLDPSQRSFSLYFATVVKHLLPQGYKRGLSVHGAPYDFRRAANEHGEYFKKVKALVEDTYRSNENTSVILICHSMGSPMMLYFLSHQKQAWKDQYVRGLLTLAGVWGGTARALKVFAVGDNLGAWLLNEKKLMWEQRASPSLAWLMPQESFWPKDEVLVVTPDRNYTRDDYKQFFADLKEPHAWQMRLDTKDLLAGLPPPGVEMFCLHGSGVETTEQMIYSKGQFPASDPAKIIKGDGDGTVNMRSLLGCTRWDGKQKQKVHHHVFPGLDHLQVLRNDYPSEFVANIVKNLNNELNKQFEKAGEEFPTIEIVH